MTDEYRPVPKPALSNPMAEALAEDAAAAAQTAPPETPAPVEAAAVDDAPAAIDDAPLEAAPNEDPAKPAKGNEKALLARIAKLSGERRDRDAREAELTRQNAALQALLASQGTPAPADGVAPPAAAPAAGLTQADVESRARAMADLDAYNRVANDLYGVGKDKFGTWDESLANLNAAGIMSEPALQRQMVEAAMATGAAPDVINHLGQNLDEAVRIAGLPPARMGVELATLAAKLAKKTPAISAAPAPIGKGTVKGSTEAAVDLAKLAEGPMPAYVEARKKAGDRWAGR